jgi:hypothetical protein
VNGREISTTPPTTQTSATITAAAPGRQARHRSAAEPVLRTSGLIGARVGENVFAVEAR